MKKEKLIVVIIAIVSISIVAFSWLFNMGLKRLFMTFFLLVPFVHAVVVFTICVVAANHATNKKLRLYNFLFCLTYVLSNIFYPDVDEVSGFLFFGLIKNEFMCNLGGKLSIIAFVTHIILLVLQVVEIRRTNKKNMEKL